MNTRDYPLTSDLNDERAYAYFLWDDPMTVGELRHKLRMLSEPERLRLLGKIMREARDTDVWRFTTRRSGPTSTPPPAPGPSPWLLGALASHLAGRRACRCVVCSRPCSRGSLRSSSRANHVSYSQAATLSRFSCSAGGRAMMSWPPGHAPSLILVDMLSDDDLQHRLVPQPSLGRLLAQLVDQVLLEDD